MFTGSRFVLFYPLNWTAAVSRLQVINGVHVSRVLPPAVAQSDRKSYFLFLTFLQKQKKKKNDEQKPSKHGRRVRDIQSEIFCFSANYESHQRFKCSSPYSIVYYTRLHFAVLYAYT